MNFYARNKQVHIASKKAHALLRLELPTTEFKTQRFFSQKPVSEFNPRMVDPWRAPSNELLCP